MSKALEAGQWCKPRNEQEWKAVLDLAEMLGLGGHETGRSYPVAGGLGGYKLVSVISDPFRVVGCHYSLEGCLCVPSKKLSVPDFIAGMYALAEQSKPETMIIPPTGSFTDRYFQGTDPIPSETEADLRRRLKFMEDTIASLDVPKPDGLEDRIKALEDVGPIEFRNPQKLILELRPVFASQGDMLRVIQRIEALEKGMTKTTSVLDDAFEVDKMLKQRLEKLEGHRIACIGDHQEAFHAERRLSKLEAAFNEHLVKERENTK